MRGFVFFFGGLFAGLVHASAADDVPLNESLMVLNVQGGHYQSFLLETAGKPVTQSIELSVERANPHPNWAPSSLVCAVAKSSSYHACLRVSAPHAESTDLYVTKLLYKDDRTLESREPVPGSFKMGDKVRIAMRAGPDSIEFKVEDGAWLMQALPFTPESVRLNCSSALCKLRLLDRPAAP